MLKTAMTIMLMTALVGCMPKAPQTVPINPGVLACTHANALNALDCKVYDILTITQGVIDQGKKDRATMPGPLQTALTVLESGYNTARVAWLAWREAVKPDSTVLPATRDALEKAMIKTQAELTGNSLSWDAAKETFPNLRLNGRE